jgi:polysaccharide biosynthesis/export protein
MSPPTSRPHFVCRLPSGCGSPATLRDFPETNSWQRNAFLVISVSYMLPEPTRGTDSKSGALMRRVGFLSRILAVMASVACSGCWLMPTSGPAGYEVRSGSADVDSLPYALVKLNPQIAAILARNAPRLSASMTPRTAPREIRFGVGDIVGVTIFEANSGGLFIPAEAGVRPGNFITLPNQAVDHDGNISVPYAGVIRAKGRTPTEVQKAIVETIKNRAIDPQAVVTLVEQRTSLISVLGDVNTPARFPANAEGERILDAVARAGGPRSQGFDSWLMLERGGRRETVPFGALVYEPSNNVYVHPNDTIYLYREPQTFVAFGAVGVGLQGQFNFDAWRISLAEAVAKANGMAQALADPASVFLYRGETRDVAEQLGVDCSRFEGPIIPIVYNANLRDPSGFFLATTFQMRNKDVLYISNAPSVEIAKVLDFLRLITATVNDPIIAATNAYTLKNVASGISSGSTFNVSPPVR